MTADQWYPRLPHVGFVTLLVVVYSVAAWIAAAGLLDREPALAAAVTLDVVVLVPALFYLLVVRTTRLPGAAVLPVFLLGLLGAAAVLPAEHETALDLLRGLALPAEALLIGYVAVRTYRGARRAAATPAGERRDLVDRLTAVLRELVPVRPIADAAAHELATLHYALLAWRAGPDVHRGELAFSYHRRSGYAGVLLAAGLAAVVETVAVHMLVAPWSATLAWGLTGLGVYGLLWLLGHFQAVRLRPVLLTPETLHVRIGLRWSVRVPYDRIAAVRSPAAADRDSRSADYLHAVPIGAAQLLVELREPVFATGWLGATRGGVRRIGIAVDARDRFAAELRARAAAAG